MKKNKKIQLNKLKKEMEKDVGLPLKKGSTNLVFGEGSENAQIMFIGEGPGYWEDVKGRPFVGPAGKFLDELLGVINLPRDSVFITNVICYRPPNNRDPSPEEIGAFQPYIDRMIGIINPQIIVTLGRFSMAKFIPGVKISAVHGKARNVYIKEKDIVVVPMYHPAAGLRRGEIKMQTIEDFKKLPAALENINLDKVKIKEQNVKQMHLI